MELSNHGLPALGTLTDVLPANLTNKFKRLTGYLVKRVMRKIIQGEVALSLQPCDEVYRNFVAKRTLPLLDGPEWPAPARRPCHNPKLSFTAISISCWEPR
jgi:hypothetical protein